MGVSAIVTAHNEERFLKACLDSILSQTELVDELIVIDDMSTDRTLEIAREYPADVYSVRYGSTYLSKRMAICLASHDVVLAVDGDTVLAPDFLEIGHEDLEEGYDAATGMVHPHMRNPINDVIAALCNRMGVDVYFSGPGYVLYRPAYIGECRVERENGFVDLCENLREIPLERLNTVKNPNMHLWTDLPSSKQKATIVATGTLGGAYLLIS